MNKNKYRLYKWGSCGLIFCLLFGSSFTVFAQTSQEQNELQVEDGQLKIDAGRVNKNAEVEGSAQDAVSEKYGIAIFEPNVATAYIQYREKEKQQREKDKSALFLTQYPKVQPKYSELFQTAPQVKKAKTLIPEQYVDISYLIYIFIALLGSILIIFLLYMGKKELNETVEKE